MHELNLTIIELTMWLAMWQPTPTTADVTVTKIAGYVRVRILMNRWFFRIFGIRTFYATATLLNIWIYTQWTDAADLWGQIRLCTHAFRNSSNVGVSLRARHDTTQVMLGVSLPVRCDTTLAYQRQNRIFPKKCKNKLAMGCPDY